MVKRLLIDVRSNLESTDPKIAMKSRKALREHMTWLRNKREEISGVLHADQKLLSASDSRPLSAEERGDD